MIQFSKMVGVLFLSLSGMFLVLSAMVGVLIFELSIWMPLSFSVNFSLLIDWSSLLFMSTVMLISGSVMIYCSWYMDDEVYYKRFVFLVLLFVGSMAFLILIPNLVSVLIGWDGLGITSFLLVVYYQNNKSLGAGMVTALVNRIGDVLLLISIGVLISEGSWLVYNSEFVTHYPYLGVVLLFGAITKSAQIPFSAWLPAAMAAPTPVSSLVHSSTLVTAGVYLLYRSYFIISMGSLAVDILKILSLLTLVMAGSAALVESDLKKVIALSTLSQLSMMLFSLSLGLDSVTFFHLVSHASFKALLFLCAGVVIHSNLKTQDMRLVGKNWAVLPISMSCLSVANMSLCGIPFLSGFYSKDLIIELSFLSNEHVMVYILEILGTLFTSWYSLRLSYNVMFGLNQSSMRVVFGGESVELKMSYLFLLISSVVIGWSLSGVGEKLSVSIQLLSLDKVFVLILFLCALYLYGFSTMAGTKNSNSKLSSFLGSMWSLKSLTTQSPTKVGMGVANEVFVVVEKGWLEAVGPQGVYVFMGKLSKMSQSYQQYSFLYMMLLNLFLSVVLLIVFTML